MNTENATDEEVQLANKLIGVLKSQDAYNMTGISAMDLVKSHWTASGADSD